MYVHMYIATYVSPISVKSENLYGHLPESGTIYVGR